MNKFNSSMNRHHQGASSSNSEGRLLHQLLCKLKYGDLEKYPSSKEEGYNLPVDPSVLDWIFHCNETSTSFIVKLCDLIKSDSMILTENEIKEFEELERQGKILHGNDLEQALELGDNFYRNKNDAPIEDLEKELELLSEELDVLENQLEKKKIQKDKLKDYFDKLGEKQFKSVQSISMKNLDFTRILTKVKNTVEEYVKTLSNHSLLNLTELNLEHDRVVEENLRLLMEKFNENDASEDNLEKHSRELNRLSSIFKTTEEQYLTNLTTYKKLQASLECANNHKEQLYNYQHFDISTIIENIEKTKKQVTNLKSIILQYITNDIPVLVKDLTELNSVNVINQDYIKKLDFEQKRNEELNMILNHVLTRYSTLRLLNECFNMEYTNIYKDYLLINCIIIELNDLLQGFENRCYHYQRLHEIQLLDKQQAEISSTEDVSTSLYSVYSDLNSILSNDFQNFISNSPLKSQNLSEILRNSINETRKEIHELKLNLNSMIEQVVNSPPATPSDLTSFIEDYDEIEEFKEEINVQSFSPAIQPSSFKTPKLIVSLNNLNDDQKPIVDDFIEMNSKLKYHEFDQFELGDEYGGMKLSLPKNVYKPIFNNEKTGAIKVLGKGSFGVVIECYHSERNEKVAVKKCINALNIAPWNIIREIECMKHLHGHPNVVELIEVYIDYNTFDNENSDIYVVTELCGKTMWEYLNEKTFPSNFITEQEIKNIMSQLLSVCVFMHSADILHRDIKPENILMKDDRIKLIDFGSATKCREQQQVEHMESVYVVTKYYRPPEVVLTSDQQSPAIDLWSIGCVFAELLFLLEDPPCRQPLFYVKNSGMLSVKEHLMKIMAICGKPSINEIVGSERGMEFFQTLLIRSNQPRVPLEAIFVNASSEALDLLSKLLTWSPKKRITPEAALRHPYLKNNAYIDTNNADEEFHINLVLNSVKITDRTESNTWKLTQWKRCLKELLIEWAN